MAADVTAIIPNWNGSARLRRLLPALRRQSAPLAEIVVVDNGSGDDSQSAAADFQARWIALGANRGFAAAVNAGIRNSSSRWLAILNNDIEPQTDWLEQLLKAAENAAAPYAAGRLLSWDHPGTLDGCFDLLSRSGLAWRAGHGQPAHLYAQPGKIRCAPFTAVLVQRDLFQRVGLLDERYGSYLEDVDFGLRCAVAGYEGVYEPAAIARHEGSATLGRWSPGMVRLLSRNQVLFIAKHFPEGWPARFGIPVLAGQLLWAFLALRRGRLISWVQGKLDALASWGEWRRHAEATPAPVLHRILLEDEKLIQRLQACGSPDRFWSLYFRLLGNPK